MAPAPRTMKCMRMLSGSTEDGAPRWMRRLRIVRRHTYRAWRRGDGICRHLQPAYFELFWPLALIHQAPIAIKIEAPSTNTTCAQRDFQQKPSAKPHRHQQPPQTRRSAELHGGAMAARNGLPDGQPQAAARGAFRGFAHKTLHHALAVLGGDSGAAVFHREHGSIT